MFMPGGSRISHHLRECDLHFHLGLSSDLGWSFSYYSTQVVRISFPWPLKSCWGDIIIPENQNRMSSSCSSSIPSKSPGEIPLLCHCFRCNGPEDRSSSKSLIFTKSEHSIRPIINALMAAANVEIPVTHLLPLSSRTCIQASRAGPPFLLLFVGIAEVLGWERSAPIVAKCDRKRVLSSWAPHCCNMVPQEFQVEFSSVRHLTLRQFVEKLAKEIRVGGVVAGENYRFEYKAAGDALELVKLREEYGMESYISSVMGKNEYSANINFSNSKEGGQVSSTRVRHALAVEEMKYVCELLGRQHRLILMSTEQERFSISPYKVSAPKSCLLNLAPKEGLYEKCSLFLDEENFVQCRVVIDTNFVYVETDVGPSDIFGTRNLQCLRIEFGDSST